jgi:hypothetical protein
MQNLCCTDDRNGQPMWRLCLGAKAKPTFLLTLRCELTLRSPSPKYPRINGILHMHIRKLHYDKSEFSYLQVLVLHKWAPLTTSGLDGLVVSRLASGTHDCGFAPGRSRRIFRAKNPQHAFLRKGSKAACPMSQICGMLKNPIIYRGSTQIIG